jgi:hypothetical protein
MRHPRTRPSTAAGGHRSAEAGELIEDIADVQTDAMAQRRERQPSRE